MLPCREATPWKARQFPRTNLGYEVDRRQRQEKNSDWPTLGPWPFLLKKNQQTHLPFLRLHIKRKDILQFLEPALHRVSCKSIPPLSLPKQLHLPKWPPEFGSQMAGGWLKLQDLLTHQHFSKARAIVLIIRIVSSYTVVLLTPRATGGNG